MLDSPLDLVPVAQPNESQKGEHLTYACVCAFCSTDPSHITLAYIIFLLSALGVCRVVSIGLAAQGCVCVCVVYRECSEELSSVPARVNSRVFANQKSICHAQPLPLLPLLLTSNLRHLLYVALPLATRSTG